MPKPRGSSELVKTTVLLPEKLWRAAKVQAVDQRGDLRDVIIAALEVYLAKSRKGGAR
jgi:hypothetical protein